MRLLLTGLLDFTDRFDLFNFLTKQQPPTAKQHQRNKQANKPTTTTTPSNLTQPVVVLSVGWLVFRPGLSFAKVRRLCPESEDNEGGGEQLLLKLQRRETKNSKPINA